MKIILLLTILLLGGCAALRGSAAADVEDANGGAVPNFIPNID